MFRRHVVRSPQGVLLSAPQRLTIRSEREGHAHVVELIGELDSSTAGAFEDELRRVEATDARAIVVDLTALNSIGSAGLKVFIQANARSRCGANRLMLLPGAVQVQKTFERAGLLSRLPFAEPDKLRSLLDGHLSRTRAVA